MDKQTDNDHEGRAHRAKDRWKGDAVFRGRCRQIGLDEQNFIRPGLRR
jgi:hypothetical protein